MFIFTLAISCLTTSNLPRVMEKEMATHSSVLAWRIPWTEEPDGLLSMGVTQSLTWLKRLSMHVYTGEGNGNPLQYSCLENPRDGGACRAAVYGVAQSRTWLKRLSSSSSSSMELTFQVSVQQRFYSIRLTFTTRHIPNWTLFLLWLSLFILSGTICPGSPTSILDTYQPEGLIFQCHIFLLFHTVHGVLEARMLKWFAIAFSSRPRFVRTLHHDHLLWSCMEWLIISLSYTRL